MKFLKTHKRLAVSGLALTVALVAGGVAFAYFSAGGGGAGAAKVGTASSVIITQDPAGTAAYDSIVSPMPPDTWGQSYGGTGITQFGDAITLGGPSAPLNNVVVALDSQACENGSSTPCTTTPGATFALPITLNIYAAGSPAGTPIATDTQTFNIPYRPSADPTKCAAGTDNWSGYQNDGTQWYDSATGKCYYGTNYAANFDFSSQNVTLPSSIVYGIAFDASSGPGSSLNVMLSNASDITGPGTDTDPGNVFVAGTQGDIGPGEITCQTLGSGYAQYSTAAGTSCGLDTPNQDTSVTNIPQVEFNVGSANDLYPGGPSQPIDFTIYNPGSSTVYVNQVTIGIASDTGNGGVIESVPGNTSTDVTGCLASWFTINGSPSTVHQNIGPGNSIDWVGTASISMPTDTLDNQNPCEGASVGLTFTSN